MMGWAKIKMAVVVCALVLLVGGVGAVVAQRMAASPPTSPAITSQGTSSATTLSTVQVTADDAKSVAAQFLTFLRDRDAQRLADLLADGTLDQRRATARRYITEFRDGWYARYPARLGETTGSTVLRDTTGQLTEAVFDANPPILADVQRLTIHLQPINGKWLVRQAVFAVSDAASLDWRTPAPTTAQNSKIPPGTYAKAFEAFVEFRACLDYANARVGVISDRDKPHVVEAMAQSQVALVRLAELLKPTDLAISNESVQRLTEMVRKWHDTLAQQGDKAFFEELRGTWKKSPVLIQDRRRVFAVGDAAAAGADAEDDAAHTTPRPPAFGPSITLTLGWNNQKQDLKGPVKVPDWLRTSATFRLWQKRSNIQTFHTRDDEGNSYEIYCMGGTTDAEGRHLDMIPSVKQYRPDGTLSAVASYDEHGQPTSWSMLDQAGKRYLWRSMVVKPFAEVWFFRSGRQSANLAHQAIGRRLA